MPLTMQKCEVISCNEHTKQVVIENKRYAFSQVFQHTGITSISDKELRRSFSALLRPKRAGFPLLLDEKGVK